MNIIKPPKATGSSELTRQPVNAVNGFNISRKYPPLSLKSIGIDANTPIFLKVLTIDGIDGLMGTIRKNSLLQTVRIVLQPIYIN
jgi:hypothetical protein